VFTSCRLCATLVNIHSSSLYQYMFWPNRPSSGVQVVVMKESAAHCNAVLFSYAVASDFCRLYGLSCYCYARVWFMVLLVCWFFLGSVCGCLEAEASCLAVGNRMLQCNIIKIDIMEMRSSRSWRTLLLEMLKLHNNRYFILLYAYDLLFRAHFCVDEPATFRIHCLLEVLGSESSIELFSRCRRRMLCRYMHWPVTTRGFASCETCSRITMPTCLSPDKRPNAAVSYLGSTPAS
jgi:hypothetical protein